MTNTVFGPQKNWSVLSVRVTPPTLDRLRACVGAFADQTVRGVVTRALERELALLEEDYFHQTGRRILTETTPPEQETTDERRRPPDAG